MTTERNTQAFHEMQVAALKLVMKNAEADFVFAVHEVATNARLRQDNETCIAQLEAKKLYFIEIVDRLAALSVLKGAPVLAPSTADHDAQIKGIEAARPARTAVTQYVLPTIVRRLGDGRARR